MEEDKPGKEQNILHAPYIQNYDFYSKLTCVTGKVLMVLDSYNQNPSTGDLYIFDGEGWKLIPRETYSQKPCDVHILCFQIIKDRV